MLVLGDKAVTLRTFPPDEARRATDAAGREKQQDVDEDEDPWDDLSPFLARPFRSEITARDSGQARICATPETFITPSPGQKWDEHKIQRHCYL